MLVMIPEMEASEQRQARAECAAARAMAVGEGFVCQSVREIGPEQEKLQRREDRGKRPQEEQVGGPGAKQDKIGRDGRSKHEQLTKPEILPEEAYVPGPEMAGMIGIEIGIVGGAGMAVMRKMFGTQPIEGKAGIDEESKAAEHPVQGRAARRQRSMHAVMRNDEQPDVQPAEQQDERERQQQSRTLQFEDEDAVDMRANPSANDRQ